MIHIGNPRREVNRSHFEYPVGVNIENDLDLGCSTRRGRNTIQFEFTKRVVIFHHGTIAFENLDL